jgi:hypothetical protein
MTSGWKKSLCVLMGLTAFSVAHAPAVRGQRPDQRAFVVAVYEGDTLLPIARYTSAQWVNTWPGPEEDSVPVPPLDGIPPKWLGRTVPREWTVWFKTGGSAPIRINATERSGGCFVSPKLVVETPPPPPADLADVGQAGLATTDGTPVGAILRLSAQDFEGRDLVPLIRRVFAAQERAAMENDPDEGHEEREPMSASRFAAVAPTVDWLFTGSNPNGPRIYYFEAAKRVPGSDPGKILRVNVGGWLVADSEGRLTPIGIHGRAHWDDAVPNRDVVVDPDRVPLGILSVGQRVIWVMEDPTATAGSFTLYDLSPSGVRTVLTADAGGC